MLSQDFLRCRPTQLPKICTCLALLRPCTIPPPKHDRSIGRAGGFYGDAESFRSFDKNKSRTFVSCPGNKYSHPHTLTRSTPSCCSSCCCSLPIQRVILCPIWDLHRRDAVRFGRQNIARSHRCPLRGSFEEKASIIHVHTYI